MKKFKLVQTDESTYRLYSRFIWWPFWSDEFCTSSTPKGAILRYRQYEEHCLNYPKVLGQGTLEELEEMFK